MPWLLCKTLGSCKEKQTRHRNTRLNTNNTNKRYYDDNKRYHNYNKRNYKRKGFNKQQRQRRTNKKQDKYWKNNEYTNNRHRWLTIKEIHERIKGITSKWEKGEYEEILKKYEGKRKRWYDILQEVYAIRKKKRIEKMQEKFKERTKGWKEDIQAIETQIKSKNPIKELQKKMSNG
ncbi:hypothetical protein, conserved [Entamoeba histolytica]